MERRQEDREGSVPQAIERSSGVRAFTVEDTRSLALSPMCWSCMESNAAGSSRAGPNSTTGEVTLRERTFCTAFLSFPRSLIRNTVGQIQISSAAKSIQRTWVGLPDALQVTLSSITVCRSDNKEQISNTLWPGQCFFNRVATLFSWAETDDANPSDRQLDTR
jgi:hypothetical protein